MTRSLLLLAVVGCVAREPGNGETSTGGTETGATSTGGALLPVEDCDQIVSRAECEAAVVHVEAQDRCAWIDVRVPGPTCTSDVVVPQCVGVMHVGNGCHTFRAPRSAASTGCTAWSTARSRCSRIPSAAS